MNIEEILQAATQKQIDILEEKLQNAKDLKSIALIKSQVLKLREEIKTYAPEKPKPKKQKKQYVQLDFTDELKKPDYSKLKIGVKKDEETSSSN